MAGCSSLPFLWAARVCIRFCCRRRCNTICFVSSRTRVQRSRNHLAAPPTPSCCLRLWRCPQRTRLKPPQRAYCARVEALRPRIRYAVQEQQEVRDSHQARASIAEDSYYGPLCSNSLQDGTPFLRQSAQPAIFWPTLHRYPYHRTPIRRRHPSRPRRPPLLVRLGLRACRVLRPRRHPRSWKHRR